MLDSFTKWDSSPEEPGPCLDCYWDRILLSPKRPKVMLVGIDMRPGMHMGTILQ